MKFAEYTRLDLPSIEKDILEQWSKKDIFHKSVDNREGKPSFVFYEGPPSANGLPGIHHVMARTIKDVFCRYKTMQGFQVKRKAGWDTHGLPVELGVEKALGITKEDIGKKISIEAYNTACRHDVLKYTKEWEDLTQKMGYWVDMDNPYITCDNRYIETVWWLLKQLYKKNLLYKGYTIQPYSPAAGTGLSTHELNQPGCYRDVKDTSCIAQFKLKHTANSYFLAWTTTPWTLPSNTALCVGATIEYAEITTINPYTKQPCKLILAKDLLGAVVGNNPYEVITIKQGSTLVGIEYEQLIPWINPGKGAFRVIAGDFVTTDEGTGIVHIAPTFGADDDKVAKQNGVPPLLLIDKDGNQQPMVNKAGKFFSIDTIDPTFVAEKVNTNLYEPFADRYVKNAYDDTLTDGDSTLDIDICVMLKQQGLAYKIEKYTHSYPHCWRTDKPVLYYPLDSWFVKTTEYREQMIAANETINWKPTSTGTGRFGKWLENLQDWNLSRSRYWGTPLPIWRTEDGTEEICIGSIEELIMEIEKSIVAGYMPHNPFPDFKIGYYSAENYDTYHIDLHRPYVDKIILVSPTGKPMQREMDLIDVWFDSGAMPYAQLHYPFEHSEQTLEKYINFPADFISEGVDQTRGWFFTLHAISVMVRNTVAFKNVISNGLVLDKEGNKMSKRLGNTVDPFSTIESYGADPLRWYMMTNASPWDNLKFDVEGVDEVRRKFFGTLYNTYTFFALYANVDSFCYSEPDIPMANRPEIDRWIISLLHSVIKEVTDYYENYEPTRAGRAIADFVTENLSNWYVRLNRKRYWGGSYDADKIAAYQTLYTCLETISRLMAPIAPFFADRLFIDLHNVVNKNAHESVHLSDFPVYENTLIDSNLEICMQLAQQTSSMILALRHKANKKVRQPLTKAVVPTADETTYDRMLYIADLIKNEVNIKTLEILPVNSDMPNVVKKLKPNFKILGKKYGKHTKEIVEAIAKLEKDAIYAIEKTGICTISLSTETIEITAEEVEIFTEDMEGWLVANEGTLTVALDITVTQALYNEGIARELVNRIQNIRKASGYEIVDRIYIEIEQNDTIKSTISQHIDYIATQTLSNTIVFVEHLQSPTLLELDDFNVSISIKKA